MFLENEPALVLLACTQGHVAFVSKLVKHKRNTDNFGRDAKVERVGQSHRHGEMDNAAIVAARHTS